MPEPISPSGRLPGTSPLPPLPPLPPAPRPAAVVPGGTPAVGDDNQVITPANAGPTAADNVNWGELSRLATTLANSADAVQTGVEMATNGATAVASVPDAVRAIRNLPPANPNQIDNLAFAAEKAQAAGRVLGIAGAALALKDLYSAVYPSFDLGGTVESLSNFAWGLATAGEGLMANPVANKILGTVGGVAGVVSSLFALASDIQDAVKNGLNTSNVLGMIGNFLTGAASLCLLIPGLQPLSGVLFLVGGAINLARLAYDNWDTVVDVTGKAVEQLGEWAGQAANWFGGFFGGTPAPAPAPAGG